MGEIINIETYTGPFCVSFEDGESISQDIYEYLDAGNKVTLNFKGVRIFASPFFNALIGYLLKNLENKEVLENNLQLQDINPSGEKAFKRAKNNALEYYLNPDRKKHLDNSFLEELEEV